jgi:hypothetical protein
MLQLCCALVPKREPFLEERQRAEDILLGGLGFAEDARIVSIERGSAKDSRTGYRGLGVFSDGAQFPFECEDALDELQEWALTVLQKQR